jgi:hypothetical protein
MRQRSRNLVSLLVLSLLLLGCSSSEGGATAASAPNAAEKMGRADVAASTEAGTPEPANSYLVNEIQVADRWLVRNGSLSLEVKDIPAAHKDAVRLIRAQGGYVESESMAGEPLRVGSMTARVPVQKYQDTIDQLKAKGRVLGESSNTEDVTTQAVDAQARLKALRAEEESLLQMYRRASNVDDLLKLRSQVASVRQQIESTDAQLKSLARMSALSTITIDFRIPMNLPPDAPSDWAGRTFQESYAGLLGFLRGVADLGIRFVVYTPVWGPMALVIWLLVRRAKKYAATAM